jgi:ATP-dependent protease HslVU (ClpYQ) peptidase subunit
MAKKMAMAGCKNLKSLEILLPIAKKVELMVISGQKHIISEDYDINQIYNVIL